MNMEYNSQRDPMIISEYGRNVQKLIKEIVKIEDRERRTKAANIMVNAMSALHQGAKDYSDFKQKLWDHLHTISDFKLDVDSPYPIPEKDESFAPERIGYTQSKDLHFRYYGRNLEQMIKNTAELEEGEAKTYMVALVANTMKKLYLTWNKDTVNDDVIKDHLLSLSGGKLTLPEDFTFEDTTEILKSKQKVVKTRNIGKKNKGKSKRRY